MLISPEEFKNQLSDDFLAAARQRTDPSADMLLAALVDKEGKAKAKEIFELLIRHIELPLDQLPQEVVAFIQAHRQLPSWAQMDLLHEAQDLFVDHGPKFLLFLYYKSLPILYACKNGAQVLVHTGRLAHSSESTDVFTRRIAETGQFLINVMEEGSFEPGGKAIDSILKVRLIHAAIRQFVPTAHWDAATFGQPINQEDLAITLMTFGVALTDALEKFEIYDAPDHYEAYVHCWNVVGHLMGIEEKLLSPDMASARHLLRRIEERQSAASPEGEKLAAALVDFAQKTLPSRQLKSAPQILIPFLIGEERAQMLGISSAEGCLPHLIPGFLSSLLKWGEKLEQKSVPLKITIDLLSREMSRQMVRFFNNYKQSNFRVPAHWDSGVEKK